jgi:YD repeat-containing protein
MRFTRFLLAASALSTAAAAAATELTTYSYDARGRLTGVTRTGGPNGGLATTYTLDKADNRVSKSIAGAASPPSFSIGDASGTEGGTLLFTVTKTGATSQSHTINYGPLDGDAWYGHDYTVTGSTLTFAPSETTKTISAPTIDNSVAEPVETFRMNIQDASGGATISDSQGIGTINDNDTASAPTSFSINDATATEGGTLVFTVTRAGGTSQTQTISYGPLDGDAWYGSDYTVTGSTLTFAPGETTKTISAPTINNTVAEPTEFFRMNIYDASGGATISDSQGIGTINDNDP